MILLPLLFQFACYSCFPRQIHCLWHHLALCVHACVTKFTTCERVLAMPLSIHGQCASCSLVLFPNRGVCSVIVHGIMYPNVYCCLNSCQVPGRLLLLTLHAASVPSSCEVGYCTLQSTASQHFMIPVYLLVQAFDLTSFTSPFASLVHHILHTGSSPVEFSCPGHALCREPKRLGHAILPLQG